MDSGTNLEALERLIDLLRSKGVMEYSANGVSLRFGGVVTVQPADGPKAAAEPVKPVDPKVKSMFARLPAGYDQLFEPKA